MEGISIGSEDDVTLSSNNIFAILKFKRDDMVGYWPYSSENLKYPYTIENGIPTMAEERYLSAKCLIKW